MNTPVSVTTYKTGRLLVTIINTIQDDQLFWCQLLIESCKRQTIAAIDFSDAQKLVFEEFEIENSDCQNFLQLPFQYHLRKEIHDLLSSFSSYRVKSIIRNINRNIHEGDSGKFYETVGYVFASKQYLTQIDIQNYFHRYLERQNQRAINVAKEIIHPRKFPNPVSVVSLEKLLETINNKRLSLERRNASVISRHLAKFDINKQSQSNYLNHCIRDCMKDIASVEHRPLIAPGNNYLSYGVSNTPTESLLLQNTLLRRFQQRIEILNKQQSSTEKIFA
jgi:hypothetical protein